ncbi:MAG: ROK family transcriptional regulator [Verrucomicrobiales bacterium]|nr:ROK family transcriptional regulator [Verrucomicrobiales bacterium]
MDPATLESLIVREIRKANAISRRDLADRLEVARSTAGRRVDSLIERGLLKENGVEEKFEAGRPKRFLGLCGEFGRFVGFDFDARYVYAILTDFSQEKLREKQIRLGSPASKREVIRILRETIQEFQTESGEHEILGYGIGVPGRVRQDDRIGISYPYIDGWENVDLATELSLDPDYLHLENNTKTIALGEYWLGHEVPPEHLICLSIRTGISAAIISNGHLLRGTHEMAGEIRGWQIIRNGEREWIEDGATVRAILDTDSLKGWKAFVTACHEGDPKSLATLEEIIPHHADTVSRLVQLSDPELVVISGAFNELGDLYLKQLQSATSAALANHYFKPPPVKFVAKGEFTGALGAAALAAKHFKPDINK